MYNNASINK